MTYHVPTENGCIGHAPKTLRAEINLGLKHGYGGFQNEKSAVLAFITEIYKISGEAGRKFLPFVVTDSVITYAYPESGKWVGEHEPALVLTSDKSPLYAADMSDENWRVLVEKYATFLSEEFKQFRVYVTYTQVEVKILQKD